MSRKNLGRRPVPSSPPRPRAIAGTPSRRLAGSTALGRVMQAALWSSVAIAVAGPAVANPAGGSVIAGTAMITQPNPSLTQINQSSSSAVINWKSFSIAPGETTSFTVPTGGTTLNRVTGPDPSVIAGHLTSNGQVVLVNQNGIAFSNGAQVDVNSIIATPADIRTGDFMAGRLKFDIPGKPDATVTNAGIITVAKQGFAALVAPGTANSGVINAKLGRVVLAGAETFAVDLYGDGLMSFDVGASAGALTRSVSNTGRINAAGGRVELTAETVEGIVTGVVNLGGEVHARSTAAGTGSVTADAGANGTLTVTGTVDVTGVKAGRSGGTVKLLGDKVAVANGATIDASGAAGGGTILVGGSFHGAGPERNATATLIEGGALLKADALASGNGGRIAVWSEQLTGFAGRISARGGGSGGDGGTVEVSSHGELGYAGYTDLTAAQGQRGTLLLDPRNIVIATAPTGTDKLFSRSGGDLFSNVTFADSASKPAVTGAQSLGISTADLAAGLNGANVTLQANNDITFHDSFTATGSGNLTLQAGRSIIFGDTAAVTVTLKGSLTATANNTSGAGFVSADRGTGDGNIVMHAGSVIDTSGGSNGNRSISLGIDTTAAATTGTLTLTTLKTGAAGTGAGDVTISGPISNVGASGNPGTNLAITAGGKITTGDIDTSGASGQAAGSVTLTAGAALAVGSVTAGTFSSTSTSISFGSISATGAVTVATPSGTALSAGDKASGGLHLSDADLDRITASVLILQTLGTSDDVTLAGIGNHNGYVALAIASGRDVIFGDGTAANGFSDGTAAGALTLKQSLEATGVAFHFSSDVDLGANSSRVLTLDASGAISQTGGVLSAGSLTGTSGGGTALNNQNVINQLGPFTNTGAGGFALTEAGTLALVGTIDAGTGALALTASGSHATLSLASATLQAGGTLSLTAGDQITQNSDGVLKAASLTGSSGGQTNLIGANQLSGLGSFSAASNGFTLNNAAALTQAVGTTIDAGGSTILIENGGKSFTQSGTLQTTSNNAAAVQIDNTGALAVGTISVGANGGVVLGTAANPVGPVSETGTITASTLTVQSAGGAALTGANAIGTLGPVTNTGTGDVSITVNQTLTVGATIDAGSGNSLTLTATGAGSQIQLGSQLVRAGDTVTLNAADLIAQGAGGIVRAGSLAGSASGAVSLVGANEIGNLGGFTTGNGAFTLNNTVALTQTAATAIDAGSGAILIENGGKSFTQSGTLKTTNDTGSALQIDSVGALSVGTISVGTGNGVVTLGVAGKTVGPVSETGTITAASLTAATSGGLVLDKSNALKQLGSISNGGGGDVTISNGSALTQTATIDAGSGNLSLATTAGQLSLGGTLKAGSGKTISLTGAGGVGLSTALTTNATTTVDAQSGAYADGGHTLATGNHALSVTAASMTLSAAIAFDSGSAGTTIAASSGSALTAGDGITGGLHLADADLDRVHASQLTLATSGAGDDVKLAGIGPHGGYSTLATAAGRDVLISGDVNVGAGTLSLGATGAATQSNGAITAATLTGATGSGATLLRANAITKLGDFSNSGSGDVKIADAQTLTVTGTVDAGAGNTLALTTTGTGSQLLLATGTLQATGGTVQLNSADLISQAAGGAIKTGTLTGNAHGAVTLLGQNQVSNLGSFATASNAFSLVNTVVLTQTGGTTIDAGSNSILIENGGKAFVQSGTLRTTSASAAAIQIDNTAALTVGTLDAKSGTVVLGINGKTVGPVTETGTIGAAALTGAASGDVALTTANQITTLGAFSNSGGSTAITNGTALAVAGPISSSGGLTLTTTSGVLSLSGTLNAGSGQQIALTGAGGIALAGNLVTNVATSLDTGGTTYTDNTFTISSGGHTLSLTTANLNLTAPVTSFDSGGAATTIAAPTGSGLSAGDSAAGGLHVSDADIGRVSAAQLILKTTGPTDDITASGIGNHPGIGLLTFDAGRDVLITGNISLGAGSSNLSAGRTVKEGGGVIISADTVSGQATGGITLTGNNAIVHLGSFTNSGTGNVAIANSGSLILNGNVDAGAGNNLTLTTFTPGSQIALGGFAVSAVGGKVTLDSAGSISQSGGGTITAATLTGSATGSVSLLGTNHVDTLAGFTTGGGDFAFGNAVALTQAAGTTVDAGAGTILIENGGQAFTQSGTLRTTNATASAVRIDKTAALSIGTIDATAGTVTLGIAGKTVGPISETGTISAATLAGASTGGATLTGANRIAALGNFSNGGSGDVKITNAQTLTVAGTVDAGAGNDLTLQTTGGGSQLVLGSGTVRAASGTVTLDSASAVSQDTGGVIIAATLTGNANGAVTLAGANQVSTLAAIQTSGNAFAFTNTVALTQAAGSVIDVGAGTIVIENGGKSFTQSGTLRSSNSGSAIRIDDTASLSIGTLDAASGTVTLGIAGKTIGPVSETGTINAAVLTGSTSGGAALTAGNTVTALGDFANAGGDLSVTNAGTLTVAGTVSTTGNLTLASTGSGSALLINGTVQALSGTVTLASADLIGEGAAGVIATQTLTASANGTVTLTASNQVSALAGVTTGGNAFAFRNTVTLTQLAGTTVDVGGSTIQIENGGQRFVQSGTLTTTNDTAAAVLIGDTAALTIGTIAVGTNGGTVTLGSLGKTVGPVDETGTITAGVLSGVTSGGAALTRGNLLTSVGSFSNGGVGDVAITNARSLTVAGPIDAGGGNTLTLTTTGAGHDLALGNSQIAAVGGTVRLVSADQITQGSGGVIAADALAGSAVGTVSLVGANQLAGLSGFTAGGDFALNNTVALTQSAGTTLDAGSGAIVIDNGGRDFIQGGTLKTSNDTAGAVTIRNTGALTVGTIKVGTGGGTVTLGVAGAAVGPVSETGTISAAILTATTQGGAALTGSNTIRQLGAVSNSGGGDVAISNAATLTLAGTIDVGANSNLTLTTTGAGHALVLGDSAVTAASGTVTLNSADAISQTAGGVITAAVLSGSSAGGTTLPGANQIATLRDFVNSGAGGLTVVNARSLGFGVAGLVASGTDNLTLISTNSGPLLLQGTLNAGAGKTIALTAGAGLASPLDTAIALTGNLTTNATTIVDASGHAFADGGFRLSTGGNPLTVKAAAVFLGAATSFDAGSGTVSINGLPGSALSIGDGTSGGLHLSDADLGRINAATLTLGTTGTADITIAGVSAHAGIGTISIAAAGNVTFGNGLVSGASSFAQNLTVSGQSIALNSDVNAGAHDLVLNSATTIHQGGGVLTAGTLSGFSKGGTSLTDGNAVAVLGSFGNTGTGGIALINAASLLVTGGSGGVIDAGGGSLILASTGGTLSLHGLLKADGGSSVGTPPTPITLRGAGGISLTGNAVATVTGTVPSGATTIVDAGDGAFTDNGFKLTTSNSALALTAGRLALTATLSLDSGGNPMTITAGPGLGLLLSDAPGPVAGALKIAGSDFGRFNSAALTLRSTAGSDMVVDGFVSQSSLPLTLVSGRTLTFGSGSSTFLNDVTADAVDIVFSGNFTAAGRILTVHASNTIFQTANSAITAKTLTGSSVGDATFNGPNRVNLGAFSISGNSTLTFNSADPIDIEAPITLPTGNLTLGSGGSITINADVTVGGKLAFNANGKLTQTGGILTATSFSGSSVGGADIAQRGNRIGAFSGFANSGSGDVTFIENQGLAVGGDFSTPGTLTIVAPTLTITDSRFTAPTEVILSAKGPVTQTGTATFTTRLAALDGTGADLPFLRGFDPTNMTPSLKAFVPGSASGPLKLQTLNVTGALLLSAGSGAITAGPITAAQLAVDGGLGSATLSGTIGGSGGVAAAQIAFKSGDKENSYKINDCAIGSTTCIVVPRFVPNAAPSVHNFILIEPSPAPDDTNLQAFSVGNEDLLN